MTLAEHLSAIQRDDGRLLPESVKERTGKARRGAAV
jgi:hypothetical protein